MLFRAISVQSWKQRSWTEVAEKLNCYCLFRDMLRDLRNVGEQWNNMLKD